MKLLSIVFIFFIVYVNSQTVQNLSNELYSETCTSGNIICKGNIIRNHLNKAVLLLKEVGKEEPAFGKPLERATMTIDTLNQAIHNLFLQYKSNGTNPTGGYKSGGARYGGRKPGGY